MMQELSKLSQRSSGSKSSSGDELYYEDYLKKI